MVKNKGFKRNKKIIYFLIVIGIIILISFSIYLIKVKSYFSPQLSPGNNCIDSDKTIIQEKDVSYFIKGNIKYRRLGFQLKKKDKCLDKNNLIEWYCKENNNPKKINVGCENGCEDGTCYNNLLTIEGKYSGFYNFPKSFFSGSSLIPEEIVQVTDVEYILVKELSNNPSDFIFGKIEYKKEVYGSSGSYGGLSLGDAASPTNNGGDHSWDVIAHEMGHSFWSRSSWFYEIASPGPFLQEATAVLSAQYVYERIKLDPNNFGLSKNQIESLDRIYFEEKDYQKSKYDEFIKLGKPYSQDESGPNYAILTSQAFDYKMFLIGDEYGWDKFSRFYKAFSPELRNHFNFWEGGISEIEETTYAIAALGVAFDKDFRQEFKDLNFPIDDSLYSEIYPVIKEYLSNNP